MKIVFWASLRQELVNCIESKTFNCVSFSESLGVPEANENGSAQVFAVEFDRDVAVELVLVAIKKVPTYMPKLSKEDDCRN